MPRWISVILISLAMLCGFGSHATWAGTGIAVPAQDYTLYGALTVDGTVLDRTDTSYSVIAKIAEIGNAVVVTYTMGDDDTDDYNLKIPMSIGDRVAGTAQQGETASIFVVVGGDEFEVDQSPRTVGAPADFDTLDLTAEVPPGEITNLTAHVATLSPPDFTRVALTWTAPGGDGQLGTVTGYEGVIASSFSSADPRTLTQAELEIWWDGLVAAGLSLTTSEADGTPWGSFLPAGGTESRTAGFAGTMLHDNTFPPLSIIYYVGLRAIGSEGPITGTAINMPPQAYDLDISPSANVATDDNITASYSYRDPEDDPEVTDQGADNHTEIKWYKDGVHQPDYDGLTVLPASATSKGEEWYFTVQPGDGGSLGPIEESAHITIENSVPVADANGPYTGKIGDPITLDGSGSTDADNDPLTYAWDLGDTNTATGVGPTHTYAAAGVYNVSLVVNDGEADSVASNTTVTITDAELEVTKVVDDAGPTMGDIIVYTVTVTNNGPDGATNVVISDPLPAGLTFSASNGSYDPGTGDWTIASLANGASTALIIEAIVNDDACGNTLTNTATVAASDQGDSNPENNSASAESTVVCSDLAITKAVDNPSPVEGDTIEFTIVVTNNGPNDATDAFVSDPVPAGVTYIGTTTNTGGAYDPVTGVWDISPLANGASATLAFQVMVVDLSGEPVVNVATAIATFPQDPDLSNNTASVSLIKADVAIVASVDNATPNEGDEITLTLGVTNNGPDPANDVVVNAVPVPVGLTYVGHTASQGTYNDSTFAWDVGTLLSGESATATVTVAVDEGVVNGETCGIPSTTNFVASQTEPDPDLTNNTDAVTVTVQCADLGITKEVSDTAPNEGDAIDYTIVVVNSASSGNTATNVVVSDPLPVGVSFVSDNASQGSYADGTWDVGSILVEGSATLTLTVMVDAGTCASTIPNTATIVAADQADPNSQNDSASAEFTVQCADLAVTKVVDNATPLEGETIVYTISVTNNGVDAATGLVIGDLLPAGVTYVGHTAGADYVSATGAWTIGELDQTGTEVLEITATVDIGVVTLETCGLPITNTAAVAAVDQADPTPENNSASVDITPQCVDLAVAKVVDNDSPTPGDNVVYTITITNNGPSAATTVVIADVLPAGVTYVSSSTAKGTAVDGTWNLGDLAISEIATLDVTVSVDTDSGLSTITNTASVASLDQVDPNNTNDSASVTLNIMADLAVAKVVDDNNPNVGDNVVYTVTVTNNGPGPATSVIIDDALPAGVTYVLDNPSQGTYVSGSWDLGELAKDAYATLDVTVSIDAGTCAASITNTAAVASVVQADPDDSNNSASVDLVVQCADLAIAKSVDDETPNAGTNVVYSVTVSNNGPDDATNVVVNEPLPAGLTYLADNTGDYDSASGEWAVGTVANGSSVTLEITAVVSSDAEFCGETIGNTTNIASADQEDPDISNNEASASITVQCADLAVTKAVDDDNPNAGDTITFTIEITNNGPSDATGIVVNEPLIGMTAGEAIASSGIYGGGVWTIDALASGTSATLTLPAVVDAGNCGLTLENTASIVAADQTDPVTENNEASIGVTVQCADLAIAKVVDNPTPNVGDTVVYALTVTNAGPDAATGVVVTDPLQSEVTFVSADSEGYDSSTGEWAVGTVDAEAEAVLMVTVTINSETCASLITNTAVVAADQEDPDTSNNEASANIVVQCADLVVNKVVDEPSPNVGDTIVYTVSVVNDGPDMATNVAVADSLPAGVTYVDSVASQGDYDSGSGVWTVGNLGGAVITDSHEVPLEAILTITATVDEDTCANIITNTAEVIAADQEDPDVENNADSAEITVQCADLVVSKEVDNDVPNPGDSVSYTIAVANNGPDTATSVLVEDIIPGMMSYDAHNASQGTYDKETGIWDIGELLPSGALIPSGAEIDISLQNIAILDLKVIVDLEACGDIITNTAVVMAADQADPDDENNSAEVSVAVQCADLAVTKTVSNDEPYPLDNITFTVRVTNNGTSDATGVVVDDTLPAGLTYLSSTGNYNDATGKWTVGDLAVGASETLRITAMVDADSGGADLVNTAVASADQGDPNEANNTASVVVTPLRLKLISASYDACTMILTLVFNDPIEPRRTNFDRIGMEIGNSGQEDFGISGQGSCLVAVPGQPYQAGAEVHYPVSIDIACEVPAVTSLSIAAFVTHKSRRIDLLLERGAFTDPDGFRSREADVDLKILANGQELRKKGDLSGDGEITAYDAALLLQYTIYGRRILPISDTVEEIAGLLARYGQPNAEAEILEYLTEMDGIVGTTANDASMILQYSAGLQDAFCKDCAPVLDTARRNGRLMANSFDNQTLEVSIDLDNVSNVHAADIVVKYNPQALTLTDVSGAPAISGWLAEHGTTASGEVKISLAGVSQPVEDGSLVTMSFNAVSADAIKQLDLTEFKLNGGSLKATIQSLPKSFALLQNYPNPFNPETWLPYRLSEPTDVTITIYSVSGQMVRQLRLGNQMPGYYVDKARAAYWDGRNEYGEKVSSGIYFYQLQAGVDASVRKMIIAK